MKSSWGRFARGAGSGLRSIRSHDPQPIDAGHSEFYVFWTNDNAPIGRTVQGPAIEYNFGFAPNAHVHIATPYAWYTPPTGPLVSGLGDTEVGVKVRFVQETRRLPQIGVYPMAELPTGHAAMGLGNGRTWYKLPLWLQKSWGPWTALGGGGVGLNDAADDLNFGFGGVALQRDFGARVTLGGEVYTQGVTGIGGRGTTFYNLGGYFKPSDRFNLMLSLGHSFRGESHAIGYAALYWTWGRADHSHSRRHS